MSEERQYELLIDMVANARLILANADNEEVFNNTSMIKSACEDSASALGYSRQIFNRLTIERYHELNGTNK